MVSQARSRRAPRKANPQLEVLDVRALLSVGTGATAAGSFPQPDAPPAADRLLVKFQPNVTTAAENALLAAAGTNVLSAYPEGPMVVETGPGIDPAQAVRVFQSSPLVVYAEVDSSIQLSDAST